MAAFVRGHRSPVAPGLHRSWFTIISWWSCLFRGGPGDFPAWDVTSLPTCTILRLPLTTKPSCKVRRASVGGSKTKGTMGRVDKKARERLGKYVL